MTLALLTIGLRAAAGENGRFSLTPSAGVQAATRLGRLVPLPNTADVPEIKVSLEHRQPAAGLGLGLRLNGHLELEGEFLYDRARIVNDVGIGFGGFPLGRTNISDAVLFSGFAGLILNLRQAGLSPYAGAGLEVAVLDTETIGSKTRLGAVFRAGVRAPLTRGLQVFLELRDSMTFFRFAEDLGIVYPMIYTLDVEKTQHTAGAFLGLRFVL